MAGDRPRRPAGEAADGSARPKPTAPAAFARFATVGASGVVVNLAVVWLVHTRLGVWFPLASGVATEAAIVWNYAGNELWTYHLRRLSLGRLARFNAAALVALALTVAVATVAAQALPALLAQLAGIAVGSAANFLAHFGWIWRR